MRIASFNVENLDDTQHPDLATRVRIMKPQLERLAADILCLQEVHGQGPSGARTLAALDTLIQGTLYETYFRAVTRTVSGNQPYDVRNIVTLSRYPITHEEMLRDSSGPQPRYQMVTAHPQDTTSDPVGWERPLLYTVLDVGQGRSLHLINVHLKSKLPSNIPGQTIDRYQWRTISAWAEGSFISSMKRVGQALQARLLIDRIFDTDGEEAFIAICGDFNAEATDVPLRAICGDVAETGNPEHAFRLLIPCENNVPDSSRFSLYHLGHGQMLDHIIVSRPLFGFFAGTEIHNEALPDESGAFRRDTQFPESDHAPVVAEFTLG